MRLMPSKTARHGVAVLMPLCGELQAALSMDVGEGHAGEFVLPEHAAAYPYPNRGAPGAFSAILLAAGIIGGYSFHSWRHTFRTRLAAGGVSDEIAKRLGGWTVDATAMRYDHDGRFKELVAAVDLGAAVSKGVV
jgi:integrase